MHKDYKEKEKTMLFEVIWSLGAAVTKSGTGTWGLGRGDWDVGTGTWDPGMWDPGTWDPRTWDAEMWDSGTRGLGDSEWFTIRSWLFLVFLYVIRTHYSSTVPILISPHLFSSVIRQSEGDLALKSTSSASQQVCFHSLLKYRECLVFFLNHCIFPYNIGITVGWIPNVARVCLCMHVTNIYWCYICSRIDILFYLNRLIAA